MFVQDKSKEVAVWGTDQFVRYDPTPRLKYDPTPRLAVCTSKLGASKAIAIGAYAFALKQLAEK